VSHRDARHASPLHVHLEARPTGPFVVRLIGFPSRDLPDRATSVRLLGECLDHFRQQLQTRAKEASPQRPPAAPGGVTQSAAVTVRVLERRPDVNNRPAFRVQEQGRPPGMLMYGNPPATLPDVGDDIQVYRNNNDPRAPQYRWDRPPSSTGGGSRPGPGGRPRGRR
jgi:hypothetical protein